MNYCARTVEWFSLQFLISEPLGETPEFVSSSWSCCRFPEASLSRTEGSLSTSRTWWPPGTTSRTSCRSQSGGTPLEQCSPGYPLSSKPELASYSSTSPPSSWSPSGSTWSPRFSPRTSRGRIRSYEISSAPCTGRSLTAWHGLLSQGEYCQALCPWK